MATLLYNHTPCAENYAPDRLPPLTILATWITVLCLPLTPAELAGLLGTGGMVKIGTSEFSWSEDAKPE